MSFSKLLDKTKSGEILNETETKELATILGLEISGFKLTVKIIIIVALLGASFYLFTLNIVYGIIAAVISLFFIVLLLIKKNNNDKIVTYLETVQSFYLSRFSDYEGYETLFLIHNYQRNGFLQNKLCLLLTDGYNFYIFDDMLKETQYYLPKAFRNKINPLASLKIFDQEFVKKRPVYFQLSEIDNFYSTVEYRGEPTRDSNLANDYYRYTFVPKNPVLKDFCFVELKDRTIFKFSPEAVDLFRRKAKDKEVK